MKLLVKLKEPKNQLRFFSLILYAILFAAWFVFDFEIIYLVVGLFIILAAKILFAYHLANKIDSAPKNKSQKKP